MDYLKHAVLLQVVRSLRRRNCIPGKTNVQKALAIMNEAIEPTPFEFVLYKHGPYSFDVQSSLEQMKTYRAVLVEPSVEGYGVVISVGPGSKFIDRNGELAASTKHLIDVVCEFVCGQSVLELERSSTAAWIRKREGINQSALVAKRMHELKPHVSLEAAMEADSGLTSFLSSLSR